VNTGPGHANMKFQVEVKAKVVQKASDPKVEAYIFKCQVEVKAKVVQKASYPKVEANI